MSKVRNIAQELVTKFNQEVFPNGTNPWFFPLKVHQSNYIWSRGDGARYKELGRITTEYSSSQLACNAKPLFFYWLLQQPGVKYLGKVTDENRNIDPGHAVVYQGVMFINRGHFTEFGSKSRLRNSSIWRLVND